jgi:hypothetical protein
MGTSFISEHSSEYILVAKLTRVMERHFERVIPIYFLSTREGSPLSGGCSPSQTLKIVSVFARRPKIDIPNQPFIEVKFNESLFEIAALASPLGIPTFAGVPLASSMMKLSLDNDCAWFELMGSNADVIYEISLDCELLRRSSESSAIDGPITESELVARVLRKSRAMSWDEAREHMRTIRRGARADESFWYQFGAGYHPFHLLMLSTNS